MSMLRRVRSVLDVRRPGLGRVCAAAAAGAVLFGSAAPAAASENAPLAVDLDHAALTALPAGAPVTVRDVEVTPGESIDLELKRFQIFTPDATFRVVGADGVEQPMPAPDVVLLRGSVAGDPHSRVFLGVSSTGTHGFIERGGGLEIVSTGTHEAAAQLETQVADAFALAGMDEYDREPCTAWVGNPALGELGHPEEGPPSAEPPLAGLGGDPPCRTVRVAVDTDWEFTGTLFGGDTTASAAYATTLLAAVSEIYVENLNVTMTISYLRTWSANNDPYTATSGTADALYEFRDYWRANHAGVGRETAHLLSGKSLGGGIAYVGVICNTYWAFGVSANLNGSFPSPLQDHHSSNWDVVVVAHELGHNFNGIHTHEHSPPIDGCGNGDCTDAWGGTLMSYCHLCFPGMSNIVLDFHPTLKSEMLAFLDGLGCDLTSACPNDPPTITSVAASPDPVDLGANVTLTASGASDPDGTIADVHFYHDANDDGSFDGGDTLLGSDGDGTPHVWTGSTAGLPAGTNRFFAVAEDDGGATSDAVAATATVTAAVTWTGPDGGSWFTAGNWSTGIVPSANSSVTIDAPVVVDAAGALAATVVLESGANLELTTLDATLTATAVNVLAGATLGGTGVVTGAVTNAGTLRPGGAAIGALTVAGTYTQTAAGGLEVLVDGYLPTEHDLLTVTSTTAVDGALTVSIGGGLSPTPGSLYFVASTDVTGTFATTTIPELPGAFSFAYGTNSTGAFLLTIALDTCTAPAYTQWANTVVDFSSQVAPGSSSALRALGAPDVFSYGNNPLAWIPESQNGTSEHITVGFPRAAYASGVTVRETFGNGYVTQIDLRDLDGNYQTIWSGTDASAAGSVVDYFVSWTETNYLVDAVRITIDTDASSEWEAIDAIRLHGTPGPTMVWASGVVDYSSQYSNDDFAATQTLGLPNVFAYGNSHRAWAASSQDGTQEYVTVSFDDALYATGVSVHESYGNGFVTRVDVRDNESNYHTVWTGADTSAPGTLVEFRAAWPRTPFLVDAVRIHVDTDATAAWEEIDAIRLHGYSTLEADCNGNGIGDGCDIAVGTSLDVNGDNIPDECDIAPTLMALVATPTAFPQGQPLTLTANGVDDPNDDVVQVAFYRDADDDGELDGGDALLGTDVSAAGGWTWSGTTGDFSEGTVKVFAQATDGAGLTSGVGSALVTVITAYPDGLFIGSPGGDWFTASNWGSGGVPDGATAVLVDSAVTIDGPGAVAASVTVQDGGTLTLTGGSAALAAATVTVEAGGVLTGVGTITGNVVNGGTVRPGDTTGTLAIVGGYTQQAAGTLDVDVNGYTAGTEHDVLTATGAAALDGALVVASPTLVPVDGNTATFLTAGSVSGTFATSTMPDLAGSYTHALGVGATSALLATASVEGCDVPVTSQWATNVVAFTSEWSSGPFSAMRALGPANVSDYGSNQWAWAAANVNGTTESITLGYTAPVYATGVTVRETNGAGCVTKIELIDVDDNAYTVWSGTDPSPPDAIADYLVTFAQTSYLVDAVRVTIDTDATPGWEEIDAVQLHGVAAALEQWASSVTDFSSEWSSTIFGSDQTLGAPDVYVYGNNTLAWAPTSQDGTLEHLELAYTTPVYATGVTVRETYGTGFVYRVDVVDLDDTIHTVWAGADTSTPGTLAEFVVTFPRTPFLVDSVRVHVDTDATGDWEEIDAVRLHGFPAGVADCNGNGIVDACDIAAGTSLDVNGDGVPDECVMPPIVAGLSASPDPVPQGQILTLTALDVSDPNDDVSVVRFYRDANGDGALDGGDTVLGSDSSASGGWTWAGSTASYPTGTNRFFAQAEDGGARLSGAAVAIITVDGPLPDGQYIGAPGGSWATAGNWGALSVPDGGTDVTIAGSVVVDAAGAVADAVTVEDGGLLTVDASGDLTATSITVQSGGTLALNGGAVATNVTVEAGGTLSGAGTVTGSVINGGSVVPGSTLGTLTVTVNYTQQAAGDLAVQVESFTPDSGHDVLAVGATAALDGTLTAATTPGFVDGAGTATFLTATTVSGAFDSSTLPDLGGGYSFTLVPSATDAALVAVAVGECAIATVDQWANTVIDFSSQWSGSAFSANRALGEPDVPAYGPNQFAWAASSQDGTAEHLTLGFAVPVYATGVTIRECWGNGFVTQVDVVDEDDNLTTVWTGTDTSASDVLADFLVQWTRTGYLVKGVRVYVDTDATTDWETIDAVQLHGVSGPVAQYASGVTGYSSQYSSSKFSAAQTLGAPNIYGYGNNWRAWAATVKDGTSEYLEVSFATPVYATGATIRETWGNGFVTQVDVVDLDDNLTTVWSGTDTSTPGAIAEFFVEWAQTDSLVDGLRIHIDTNATSDWEEVDTIQLHGVPESAADCNGNGVVDACDIANGTSLDGNANGIPDECEGGMPAPPEGGAPPPAEGGAPPPAEQEDDPPADLDGILGPLAAWGACPETGDCPGDLNGDGWVDNDDVLIAVLGGGGGVNDGLLAPADEGGLTEVAGDFVQTGAGTLRILLTGPLPWDEHDLVVADGTASLAGTLEIVLDDGYTPADGDAFTVLVAASIEGVFDTVILPCDEGAGACALEITDDRVVLRYGTPPAPAPDPAADLTADARVDLADVLLLLGAWGTDDAASDLDADGTVDGADLGRLVDAWG